ncbi:hypothetical protein K491DRAFT_408739 [Lophiostoma macrostomum CBS 122681]|uniref:Uncharacterized protein n=1 Tax=Lophiostoma macrostomum CBS 122681 TaxID=1314788 RepID=A0A6A6TA56_9PLEO|nr:hypothetical protein K491DRAFT_408739 [Lophiostoma macrostomum CBS 122681]
MGPVCMFRNYCRMFLPAESMSRMRRGDYRQKRLLPLMTIPYARRVRDRDAKLHSISRQGIVPRNCIVLVFAIGGIFRLLLHLTRSLATVPLHVFPPISDGNDNIRP